MRGDGRSVASQAGAVLLVETVRKCGLDTAISATLALWRRPRAVHTQGRGQRATLTRLLGKLPADVRRRTASAG
ncbi:hypothetical protein [Streptomyces sp. NPDC001978]|uniref:hypothetical protein n=1 Tax=Streptomyces sp. NPDC001978 TaxID=3364627 RepID=UPI0036CDFE29